MRRARGSPQRLGQRNQNAGGPADAIRAVRYPRRMRQPFIFTRMRGAAIFSCGVLCSAITFGALREGDFYPVVVAIAPAALLLGLAGMVVGDSKAPLGPKGARVILAATAVGLAIGVLVVRYLSRR